MPWSAAYRMARRSFSPLSSIAGHFPLATRHGITPRYVHKLFEREGLTLSHYVLGLRLDRVNRHLSDPRQGEKTIVELVYAVGFGDVSSFNRAYRARYGMTPSETRRRALSRTLPKNAGSD